MNPTVEDTATHLEALAWAVASTSGPVVELGAGWYSTPTLHGLCSVGPRELFTVDDDPAWLERFEGFRRPWHSLIHDPGLTIPVVSCAVVLVDHGRGEDRARSVREARGVAEVVVVHDTEPEVAGDYPGLAEALTEWPNRREFTTLRPWSTVLW